MLTSKIIVYMIIFCLSVICLIIFAKPAKYIMKMILQAFLSAIGFIVFNFFLTPLQCAVGINLFTLLFTGFLGLPGFLSLYVLQWLLSC